MAFIEIMKPQDKKFVILFSVIGGALLILGLLLFYQQQGVIKLFPTSAERANTKLLTIDRSRFQPPQGLTEVQFNQRIQQLEAEKQAILADPQSAQAWFNFGYDLDFLNDHADAAAVWEKAFSLQPQNFVTAQDLATDYQYFLKDYPKAEQYYLKAVAIKPDYTSAYQGLTDLYRYNYKQKQGQLEPLLLLAIKNDPGNKKTYYASLVDFFASQNNFVKARQYLAILKTIDAKSAANLADSYPALKQ